MDKRILNKPAIYRPIPANELNIATYKNYPHYRNSESNIMTSNTIYRYAKNYTFNKIPYSLCMISDSNDAKRVEEFLDKQSKGLPSEIKEHIKEQSKGLFGIEFGYLVDSYNS
jgi:hypothetical protein